MKGGAKVSIYFNPSNAHPESSQNPSRFRKLIAAAKDQLRESGMGASSVDEFLRPLTESTDNSSEWPFDQGGIVLFADQTDVYYLDNFQKKFHDQAVAGNQFYFKPLINLIQENRKFLTLCMNLDEVRVFGGNSQSIERIKIRDMPERLQDVIWPDDPEKSLQQHTGSKSSAPGRPGSTGSVMYHGQGTPKDIQGDQRERMVRTMCRSLENHLSRPVERDTLVMIAGVEGNIGLFRKLSTLSPDKVHEIPKDPLSLSQDQIHAMAQDELRKTVAESRSKFCSRFNALKSDGKCCIDTKQAAVAAGQGRIDACMVAQDVKLAGVCDPDNENVELFDDAQPGCSSDLLDYIATETVLHGGTAYLADDDEIPGDDHVVAIFRY